MLQNRPTHIRTENPLPPSAQPPATSQALIVAAPATSKKAWGFLLVLLGLVAAVVYEYTVAENYKLSTITGAYEGHKEAAELRTKLEATQAMLAAETDEKARLQQEIEDYRARMERVTEAYKTSYQRINDMAKVMGEIYKQNLAMRQDFVQKANEGKVAGAQMADITSLLFAAFGRKDIANSAHDAADKLREEAIHNLDTETKRGMADADLSIDKFLSGLPNPADIIREDRITPLRPAPRHAPPPVPGAYRQASAQEAPPAAAPPAPAGMRLASINTKHLKILLRSSPGTGDNKVCVLSQGAVVGFGAQGRVFDSEKGFSYVNIRFNRQGHGETSGWVGERVLNEFSGTAQDAKAPQLCEDLGAG